MKKRIAAIFLSVIMVMVFTLGSISTAFADPDAGNTTATKGAYWFSPHAIDDRDLTDTYVYDDALLTGNSREYNAKLATMSYELAVASISSSREEKTEEGYANKSRNLKAYLEDNGFIDFDTNQYYKERMTTETMGAACAHKQIVDNGKTYTLLAIVPRSAGYEAEWGGNFKMGQSGDHEGFKNGREIVLAYAKEYIETYGIKGDIKVWTAGYSRGAGVTNQVGAALIAKPNDYLGSSVTLTPDNLYCYTFGTPRSAGSTIGEDGSISKGEFGDPNAEKFAYIHNVWEAYDIVTSLPPDKYGFGRYGANFTYASADNKDSMLDMLQQTNSAVYEAYMNGGDPDRFKRYKIDVSALAQKQLKFVLDEDPYNYLPDNQSDFLAMMAQSVSAATGDSRQVYYETLQKPLVNLLGYYFSHTDQSDNLIEGITSSKFAIPFAVSMYISYMTDRYKEHELNGADIEEIKEAINETIDQINALDRDDLTPDEEAKLNDLILQLNRLASELSTAQKLENYVELTSGITSILYQLTIGRGLRASGLDPESDVYKEIVNDDAARAVSKGLAYILFYDKNQKEEISFSYLNQQFKHFATFAANASSYQRPHNNEVILSWLRTMDSNYSDFAADPAGKKEQAPQIAGYRRLYIDAPEGVDVSGTVKDAEGNVVATFENGKLLSRTDGWIGITTSDNGNWLRVPVDKTYLVDLEVSKDTTLNLKATEYNIYKNEEVRKETSDESYNWQGLDVKADDVVTWVISEVPESYYTVSDYKEYANTLNSDAHYYIQFENEHKITYKLNGGELDGQTSDVVKRYREGTEIKLPTPTREGYTFDYWEGSRYEAGASYTVKEDHTFTAQWIKNGAAPDQSDEKGSSVDTGDHSNALLWAVICGFSTLLLINLALYMLRARRR